MDVFLSDVLLQIKSNVVMIVLMTALVVLVLRQGEAQREAQRALGEELHSTNMTVHLLQKQLPENISHILLTPSQASKTKEAGLKSLMSALDISYPKIQDCPGKPPKKHFSKFKFVWNWGGRPESAVYQPFVDAVSETLLKLNLEIYDISRGQSLIDQLLFATDISTLRELDRNGQKKGRVLYKGKIQGKSDLVIVDKTHGRAFIMRNDVRIAIEVKVSLNSPSDSASGLRESIIQLLGLCCDNPYLSPPVLLTDFVKEFIVLSIQRCSPQIPLKFKIDATGYTDISSALMAAYELSKRRNVTRDLGRPDTPELNGDDYSD